MTTNYVVQLSGVTGHWITIFRTGSKQEAIEHCNKERQKFPASEYRVCMIKTEIIKC